MKQVKSLATIRIGYDTYTMPNDKIQVILAALALLQKVDRGYMNDKTVMYKEGNPEYNIGMADCDVYESKDEYIAAKNAAEAAAEDVPQ